ncbi:hypothetical protein NC651_021205 [Populus alba x Populus x berolinensis]|nr:hypothetical protein NC651_021205 [Populus alba x Populus x berolinensis]
MACRDAMKTAVNKASSNVIMETEALFVGDAFRANLGPSPWENRVFNVFKQEAESKHGTNWVSKAVRQLNNCGLGS